MVDLARIKRNVAKMAAQNAPESDIDGYIASEGATIEAVRDFGKAKPEEMGALEGFGRGYLQGGKNVLMGGLQAGTDIAASIFPDSESVQSFRELLPEAQKLSRTKYEAQVGDSTAAKVGEFAGEVAPYIAALPAASTVGGAMKVGAAGGAIAAGTTPTEELVAPDEALTQRGKQAVIGGAVGAAIPGGIAVAKATRPAIKTGIEKAAVKLTGINPQAAKDFISEGVQQSLAALSDRPSIKLADRWLSRFVGGAGVMERNTNKTLDDISNIINKGSAKGVTPQQAGEVIQEGAVKYTERFNNVANKLYNRLDKYLPADTQVSVNNASSALNKELSGLPQKLENRMSVNEGVRILKDIGDDAVDGNISYQNLKKYRTILGQKLSKPHLLNGEDEAVMKKAYSAITEDMKTAATGQGDKALSAFNKANSFYKQGAENIQKNLQRVISKDTPEQVYQAAISGTKLGGTKINSIMKSLSSEQKDIVRETVIKNLGRAKPGAQDATGELFSPQTFLTEWNKMSPEAKNALFSGSRKEALNKLARINERITSIDRLSNPSGTSQQLQVGALAMMAFYGDVATAGGLVLGANTSARLLTNQSFTNWLARAATKPKTPQAFARYIGELSNIAEKNPSISEDIAKYVGVISIMTNRED